MAGAVLAALAFPASSASIPQIKDVTNSGGRAVGNPVRSLPLGPPVTAPTQVETPSVPQVPVEAPIDTPVTPTSPPVSTPGGTGGRPPQVTPSPANAGPKLPSPGAGAPAGGGIGRNAQHSLGKVTSTVEGSTGGVTKSSGGSTKQAAGSAGNGGAGTSARQSGSSTAAMRAVESLTGGSSPFAAVLFSAASLLDNWSLGPNARLLPAAIAPLGRWIARVWPAVALWTGEGREAIGLLAGEGPGGLGRWEGALLATSVPDLAQSLPVGSAQAVAGTSASSGSPATSYGLPAVPSVTASDRGISPFEFAMLAALLTLIVGVLFAPAPTAWGRWPH